MQIGGFNTSLSLNQSLMNSQVMTLQTKKELEEIENMDEIQELLKIFYKFFVGAKNKPKPKNDENQPKYYKNKYYDPMNGKSKSTVEREMERMKRQKGKRSSKAWDFGVIDEDRKVNTGINDSIVSSLHEEFKAEEDFFDTGRTNDPTIKLSTGQFGYFKQTAINASPVKNDAEKARITTPIDWDDIIEKFIKNTNTIVSEVKAKDSDSD